MTEHRCSSKLSEALEFVEQQQGIELVNLDGMPTLHIDPGITPADADKWQAVSDTVEKLMACRTELVYITKRGKLNLKPHPEGWLQR